jgi:hypothetical protein
MAGRRQSGGDLRRQRVQAVGIRNLRLRPLGTDLLGIEETLLRLAFGDR